MRARKDLIVVVMCGLALGCGDDSTVATSSSSSSSTTTEGSSTGPSVGVSAWFGRFHRSSTLLPLDQRLENWDAASIANFELRPDFTASQLYHRCATEPESFEYTWILDAEGAIVLLPPAGETSFQFLGIPDLETLRITLGPECSSLVAHLPQGDSFWQRGGVCWLEQCENPERVYYASLCDGETTECEL